MKNYNYILISVIIINIKLKIKLNFYIIQYINILYIIYL